MPLPMDKTALSDDDLVVELEDEDGNFVVPEGDEEVEEFKQPALEAPGLPGGEEEEQEPDEEGEEQERAGKKGKEPEDEGEYDDRDERLAAAEERARQTEAQMIWADAQRAAREIDTQRNSISVGKDALNFRLEVAYRDMATAEEAGDSATRRALDGDIRKMEQLKAELEQAERQLADPNAVLEAGRQKANAALQATGGGKRVGAGISARHPLAERWSKSNGWMKSNRAANDYVIKTSAKMASGNWDPDSPSFYAELGKRVQLAFPNLKVEPLQARKKAPGSSTPKGAARSPVSGSRAARTPAGAGPDGSSMIFRRGGKTVVRLNRAEQQKMIAMRLDPKNPKARLHWAESRRQSAKRERIGE